MTWYLRTRYEDARRDEVRERLYLDNGEVWFVVNGERALRCRFDSSQVEAARAAVAAARLESLADISAGADDLAEMVYEWSAIDGRSGRWTNAAYPRVLPESVDQLEDALLTLEEASG